MLKKIRQILAMTSILLVTLLFVDFTGTALHWFGWMAKIQFLPALLSLNIGVLVILVLLTLLFGRVYCSVICPLGIMQDGFAWFGKKTKKNRYSFSRAKNILRYVMLGLTVIAFIFGIGWFVAILAPYSSYGRIVTSFLNPVWVWFNNLFASWAEKADSYAFYTVELRNESIIIACMAAVTLIALAILAWRNGRTYCNTICPVGTMLGILSRFSIFRPVIDTTKCTGCGLCARNCKASCIDSKNHAIDYSRCVTCFDCIGKCSQGAIAYSRRSKSIPTSNVEEKAVNKTDKDKKEPNFKSPDKGRRDFLTVAGLTAATVAVKAHGKTVDGGLAEITDKKIPERKTKIVPPGALSIRNLETHCTACQLCVSACPNGVLRPSTSLDSLMQPESSYEKGYCRPECTKCGDVCPAGAIRPIDVAEKSSIQIGHAVWVKKNCIPLTEGVNCGNCARHCPTGAIMMIPSVPGNESSVKIPAVNIEKCIGCGACENLCPARPFSAIYVEGHENHRII